jgi:hypothetical protein
MSGCCSQHNTSIQNTEKMYWLQVSTISDSHDQVKHKTYIYTGDQRSYKGPLSDAVAFGLQNRGGQLEIYIYIHAYTVTGTIP